MMLFNTLVVTLSLALAHHTNAHAILTSTKAGLSARSTSSPAEQLDAIEFYLAQDPFPTGVPPPMFNSGRKVKRNKDEEITEHLDVEVVEPYFEASPNVVSRRLVKRYGPFDGIDDSCVSPLGPKFSI